MSFSSGKAAAEEQYRVYGRGRQRGMTERRCANKNPLHISMCRGRINVVPPLVYRGLTARGLIGFQQTPNAVTGVPVSPTCAFQCAFSSLLGNVFGRLSSAALHRPAALWRVLDAVLLFVVALAYGRILAILTAKVKCYISQFAQSIRRVF